MNLTRRPCVLKRVGVVAALRQSPSPAGVGRQNAAMELDSKGLGRLQRVADPRNIWAMEAGDFTPWLAENIDVLADELGLVLASVATEVPVGNFYLDIKAETENGRTVVVENQLARTDHGHLGQLLVYASGLEAAVVIWVAPEFRDEHRRALDWLNERTDTGVDFFGVRIGVVQIGSTSPPAPVFEVVARPNAWQKDVKETTAAAGAGGGAITPINAARQDFFADVLTEVVTARPGLRMPRRGKDSWISFASGPFGYWSISFDRSNRCQVEAYIDMGDKLLNQTLFDDLAAEAEQWNAAIGLPLDWQRRDDRRHSRIALQGQPISLDDADARARACKWAVDVMTRMYDVLNEPLRSRARRYRQAGEP